MKGFKAFNKGLVCRDFQYKEGETFEHQGGIYPCREGFHFCENPLDTLTYYDLIDSEGNITEFSEVEAVGKVRTEVDKSVTDKIKIGAKLGLSGFVKASFDFLWEKCSSNPTEKDSGDYAQLASSGDSAQLTLEGAHSVGAAIGRGKNEIRGKIGCWITLAEWEYSNELDSYIPICVKSAQIDGEVLKEDVLYTLKNGEFVEGHKI